jgi:3D (Asp-Asp-Asp) domain-containing protein
MVGVKSRGINNFRIMDIQGSYRNWLLSWSGLFLRLLRKGSILAAQKNTLASVTVSKKHRMRSYLFGLAAVAVAASVAGVCVSIHAQGVIPLSTRLDVAEPVMEQPVIEQELPIVEQELTIDQQVSEIPQQNPDAELLDLLRSSMIKNADKAQWKIVRMRVTAYCTCPRCCGKNARGLTANMHKVRSGDVFVAADKRHSFGTEMIIPGYNHDRPVEVKDRGGLIKGNRLDVFYNNHRVAKKWGTRYLDVLVKVEE